MSTPNKEISYKSNAVVVAILFIIATAFLFVGDSFYGNILDTSDFLTVAYPNRMTAIIGILIEFSCILSIALIPVFAFPVLRKHSEIMAIAYIVFRLFEAVLFILVDITKLSLIKISQMYLEADAVASIAIANIGSAIQGWNEWAWAFYVFIFGFGALILYVALFQSRLVPRWISIWGLIAIVLMIADGALAMFAVPIPEALYALLVIPIGIQEMVMAVWLIIKGFDQRYL